MSSPTFASFHLDKHLLQGLKELGFVRPTPIQVDAIPPALEGRDLLACAATGSGKTAAFLLPILHKLLDRPRGTTRALVVTPTRELAAQIVEQLNALATHTPVSAAAIFGGVGMGPQEHAFRSGVDVIVATPGRLLDHLKQGYARLDKIEFLVLDEADRMLDMGFLPDIRRILKHVPTKRQTLFFSATMPAPIVELTREMLHKPATINLDRQSTPATGITQAIYPVAQDLKGHLLLALLKRDVMAEALVFTRTKHRANRLSDFLEKNGIEAQRIHGNRSQAQRTAALEGFKAGTVRVLVATDIAARGIDVEALGHVVNFDVPLVPEDYIHRIGRTGRAEETGDAFTFVSPEEEGELRSIERVLGKRLPRVTLPDFDYTHRPQQQLEIPIAQRIAEIRARKKEERERAKVNAERRAAAAADRERQAEEKKKRDEERRARGSSRPAPRGEGTRGGAPQSGSSPYAESGDAARRRRRRRGGRGRTGGGGSGGGNTR